MLSFLSKADLGMKISRYGKSMEITELNGVLSWMQPASQYN